MIALQRNIVIHRPVEEVFAFVADQTNDPRWQSGVLEVRRTTNGPVGIGTEHNFVRKFMGRRLEANTEYTEYALNEKVCFSSTSGSVKFAAGYLTEPVEGGTTVTYWIELQPKGFAGLAESFIAESLRRDVEANLAELKNLLESTRVQVAPMRQANQDQKGLIWQQHRKDSRG